MLVKDIVINEISHKTILCHNSSKYQYYYYCHYYPAMLIAAFIITCLYAVFITPSLTDPSWWGSYTCLLFTSIRWLESGALNNVKFKIWALFQGHTRPYPMFTFTKLIKHCTVKPQLDLKHRPAFKTATKANTVGRCIVYGQGFVGQFWLLSCAELYNWIYMADQTPHPTLHLLVWNCV